MSDDRPDEGAPTDPRPSGRIRIVGAQPATGEHPAVAASDTSDEERVEPTPAPEPPPADDPNRFGAVPIISADEPADEPAADADEADEPVADEPVADEVDADEPVAGAPLTPDSEPEPEPDLVPEPEPEAPRPAPDLADLDLPETAPVPAVGAQDDEGLDDIRVWAAPADDDADGIEAGRSASDDFADEGPIVGGDDDEDLFADLAGDDLPHWADPAAEDDDAVEGLSTGPRWRGQGHESDEPEDFSDLLDDTRVEPEEEGEIVFDDMEAPGDPVEASAGPPQRRRSSPYPEPVADDESGGGGGGGGGGRFGGGGGGGRDMQQAVIVGVGLVVLLVICSFIGPAALVVLATAVVVMATAEFFTATRRAGYHPAPLVGLLGSGGMVLAAYWRGEGAIPLMLFLVVVTTLCWWLFDAGPGEHAVANVAITVFGVMYVGGLGSFAALLLKFPDGVGMLFGAILVAVAADIGGLFVGQRFGSSPLTSASPNKSIEGFIGGIAASVIVAGVVLGAFGWFPWDLGDALVLGVVGGVMAPLGDLCESRLKRDLGLKDMGNLLPGHGGVLDRFDGLLFVLPATYYVVRLLEVYANTP
jgi:phosphatidate cytidylyltransferase